ncbi:hypothetical protein D9M71_38970 [compost metagenome]
MSDQKTYSGTALYDASWCFQVEAGSLDEAREKLDELALEHSPTLCHQCSDHIELGDVVGFIIYDENDNEIADTRYIAEDLAKAQARVTELEAENKALREQNVTLIEDRARFPDRPDVIGSMIGSHIGNLKEAAKQAQKYAEQYRWKLETAERKLRSRVVVVPDQKSIEPLDFNRTTQDVIAEGWNACLDELARLNGKTVSMADIRDCLDAELREWTGDHRQAVEVALTDAHGRIHALLESTQDGAAHKG